MPLWYDLSPEGLARDTTLEFFTSGGPGGQNRNKRETGVRMTHVPSGLVITSVKERSQAQNRADALSKLRSRLAARMVVKKPRKATRPTAGAKRRRLEEKHHHSGKKADRRERSTD